MKRLYTVLIFLVFVSSYHLDVAAQTVNFPDAKLAAAIRNQLGLQPSDPITQTQLAGLQRLTASDSGITDLTGLEYATGLTSLDLEQNQIVDISALSSLTQLTILSLQQNQIVDISALSSLTSLTHLSLGQNQIVDISALSSLTSLTDLSLGQNQIRDISALSSLTSLTVLWLGQNQIRDISALSSLTQLTNLDLQQNQIVDISALSSLTSLTGLLLSNNQIIDISALSSLTSLTGLVLSNNRIIDISALSSLTSLIELHLDQNRIIDISALSSLMQLTYLELQHNRIIDISALSSLTNLISLTLCDNPLDDISPLQSLVALTFLRLDAKFIKKNAELLDTISAEVSPCEIEQVEVDPDDPEESDSAESENGVAPKKRTVVVRCPVGWQRQNRFGSPTPRVLISAVEVAIDTKNRHGVYTPTAIEIYADPSQELRDLDGWKLTLGMPYNHGTDYLLTSENSVFDESGILRVKSSEVPTGLPMTDAGFYGMVLPGFDYRLFDEKNTRVDLAISCYLGLSEKGYTLLADMQSLRAMPVPRLERNIVLESFAWDADYYRSEWRTPQAAPAAPSNPYKRLTTMWATLKKQ